MCGFFIDITTNQKQVIPKYEEIENLNKRGPDKKQVVKSDNWFGEFYRLAIVSKIGIGEQPVRFRNNRFLFFNGEIYNWKSLIPNNKSFHSDTDLLAYLISTDGIEATINKLDGMYSIAVYDEDTKKLQIARDFPGIKPLYYSISNERVLVSSDIGIIKKLLNVDLNYNLVPELFAFRSILAPNTLYNNIYQCKPGEVITFKPNAKNIFIKVTQKLHKLEDRFDFKTTSSEHLNQKLHNSIILQSKSIYEPSTLLSSGIDSGLIANSLLKEYGKVNAFSVYFDNKNFSEKMEIQKDWFDKNIKINFFLDDDKSTTSELIQNYTLFKGGPVTVGNEISLVKLFEVIKSNTSVVLSGEGADELFLGYDRVVKNLKEWTEAKMPASFIVKTFLKNYYYIPVQDISSIELLSDKFEIIEKTLTKILMEFGWQKMYQYFFLIYHIPSLLDRLDKTSMFRSVEARVPFLSQSLLKYAITHDLGNPLIESECGIIGKRLLREIASNEMDREFAFRNKIGFPHPLFSGESSSFKEAGNNGWIYDQYNFFTSIA